MSKTISMRLDEYDIDLKKAKEEGFREAMYCVSNVLNMHKTDQILHKCSYEYKHIMVPLFNMLGVKLPEKHGLSDEEMLEYNELTNKYKLFRNKFGKKLYDIEEK